MALTSEQYKYLLMQRLRKYFSLQNDKDRAYTVSFFGKLFDDSVTVTEESYNAFVEQMDFEMSYCAENNIYLCEKIPTDIVNEHGLLLIQAFEKIGIGLEIVPGSMDNDGTATFTKPNGEVMVYSVGVFKNYFYINARSGNERVYAYESSPYYLMLDKPVLELDEWNPRHAGPNSHWNYDANTATVNITGNGKVSFTPSEEQIGGGIFNTVIFGANITEITDSCIPLSNVTTLVFLHAADSQLITSTGSFKYSYNTEYTIDIYTNNEALRNSTYFLDTWNITWHTLDEWEG